jgi:EAL domain-containing protein (putative c-di-GMP-specific phosphodiesterase class I)
MTTGFDDLPTTFAADPDRGLFDPGRSLSDTRRGLPDPGRGCAVPNRRRAATQDWMLFQPRLALQGGRLQAVEAATRTPPSQAGRTAPGGHAAALGGETAQGGKAVRVAAWRIEAACAEVASWRDTRVRLCVAVPADLHPDTLLSLLGELGGEAIWEHLELACPEGWLCALDGDGVLALAAISDLGVELAVEDFGESSASLALLRRLPLGVVRLHASLVRDLDRGAEDRAVLRAIVGAAHAIGLRVAATGVDSLRQSDLLCGLGCDEGVGTALSPPVPSRQLGRWIGGARLDGAAQGHERGSVRAGDRVGEPAAT